MPDKLEEYVLKSLDLPVVPVVANKVLSAAADPESTARLLGLVISRDQALASRVLRIANSAFYGVNRQINTISEAVTIIGFDGIKNLALALSMRGIYKSFGLLEQLLWDHSAGVAIAAQLAASHVHLKQKEEVFISGLLHDVGKIVLLNQEREKYTRVVQLVYNEDYSFSRAEEEIFGFDHAIVGSMVIKKWNFPDFLVSIARYHNDILSYKDGDSNISLMLALVNFADLLCHKLGIGRRTPLEGIDIMSCDCIKVLNFSQEQVDDLQAEIPEILEREKEWLEGLKH
ncbi:MAG: HDOD domain-containing protein [Nitrospirota bacterium]